MQNVDIVIIGGGIVGISTAWRLKKANLGATIVLVEKEKKLAQHQTSHNSGVIHAGVYYEPGSLKADFCKRGSVETFEFCKEHGIPFRQCGKMLVATDEIEFHRMNDLAIRCQKNEIEAQKISERELIQREPNISGVGALFVPATGITSYLQVCNKMAELFVELGGTIITNQEVLGLKEKSSGITIQLKKGQFESRYLLACAGLQADRVARMIGIKTDFQIVPFRGEYYQLPAWHSNIINHLIYPIPDPDLPFLGVHLTMMIDGVVTVGPNAVIGFKREGYGRINVDIKDVVDMLTFSGFRGLIKANLKSGVSETLDSLYKPGYLGRVRKYCRIVKLSDLRKYPAGIRAQAVMQDGRLVHDFLFAKTERSLHVCNAPSPAATSAIPIGDYISSAFKDNFEI